MAGIKETKEALIGANEIALLAVSKFKDGAQFSDFTELYTDLFTDEHMRDTIKAAYEGYKAIPDEVSDIDISEGAELAAVQIGYLPKFAAAFKKEAEGEE